MPSTDHHPGASSGSSTGRLIRVLHLDGRRDWAGGQNQVRLLMRDLFRRRDIDQLCLCPRGSALENRLRAESLPVEGVGWRGGTDPRAAVTIFQRARGFDILHAHDAHAVQAAIPTAWLRRIPLIATRRSLLRTSSLKWNRAARVIAISNAVAQLLRESGVRQDRIRLIPSAIDVDEVQALSPTMPTLRALLQLDARAFLAGNIGTLTGYKRQIVIPHAAARLPDVHWVIIGEGTERAAIESAIAKLAVSATVRLTGHVPDARRCLQELDVFVLPSVGEPLGTSVLDAMAANIPVVAADSAGPAEILGPVHRQTGVSLFPPDKPEHLAASVSRLQKEPTLRQMVVDLQRQRLADYRIQALADAVLQVYCEVLPLPKPGQGPMDYRPGP